MKRAPFSRSEKRFLLGSVLAVALLGGLGFTVWGAKSPSGIPARAPMPIPNGFDLYVAAATAMTRPKTPVDAVNDRQKRSPQEAAKIYTPKRRAAWFAANAKSWALMRQARAAQSQHPDVRANIMARLPYTPLRELARGKTVATKHFADLKRWDLALESGLDTFEMGRDIERGAPIIGSLVGIAVEFIGGTSLENVPPHLNAAQAKNGARRLEKIIADGTSPAEVLREEKWVIITQMKNNAGPTSNAMTAVMNRPWANSVGSMMDAFIAQSEKPLGLQTVPPKPSGVLNVYATIIYDIPKQYRFNVARRATQESGLLLRLALRAYRLENGAYPDNLAQLAPKYLAAIPIDPFGRGETMRYRKNGDSYLAWSIGPDGKDDGGTSIALKRGKKRVVIAPESRGDAVTKP